MAEEFNISDWGVTEEKVTELLRRIIAVAAPLQLIAFGSRARGNHSAESDLDLALILDQPQPMLAGQLYATAARGLRMEVDLIVVAQEHFDLHRPWMSSVYNEIEREGIVLYDREHPESANPGTFYAGFRGRVCSHTSAA